MLENTMYDIIKIALSIPHDINYKNTICFYIHVKCINMKIGGIFLFSTVFTLTCKYQCLINPYKLEKG